MTGVYAFLTGALDDEHELAVLHGAVREARDADATILCLPGGSLAMDPTQGSARNLVFDLVPDDAAGILALTGSLAEEIGSEGLRQWLGRFDDRPVCCMGVALEGYKSVQVDNLAGMRGVVQHLISQHATRNMAFIRGPRLSAEAEVRLTAFRKTALDAGIGVDEALIVEGDYTKASGARAVKTLLEERRYSVASLDAVVAANDYMAFGAIAEFSRRGVRVPDQVRVVGFDDVPSARLTPPQLTTVRQPAVDLGREAFKILRGPRQAGLLTLPTEVIIRRSCGCDHQRIGLAAQASRANIRGMEASFMQRRQIILAELMRAAQGSFGEAGAGWESRLLDALIADVRGAESGALSRVLNQMLGRMTRVPHDTLLLQELLSALRAHSLPSVWGDRQARDRLEASIHEARALGGVLGAQSEKYHAVATFSAFLNVSRRLRAAMFRGATELSVAMSEELPSLGISAAVVALKGAADTDPGTLLFGFGPGGRLAKSQRLPLERLHGFHLFDNTRGVLLALPLVSDGKALGVALVCSSKLEGALYEELADLFATVLLVLTGRS